MEKFRTFLKRSGALMSALVLLLCCTVPASAAGGTWGVPISFDQIGVSGTASSSVMGYAPFPLTGSGPSSATVGGIDITSSWSNLEEGMVDVDYSFSSGTYTVVMRADQLVVPASFFFDNSGFMIFYFFNGSTAVPVQCDVSYNLGRIYEGNTFQLRYQGDSFTVSSANGADLSSAIGNRLQESGNSINSLGNYILLDDFSMSFTASSPITRFSMRQNSQTTRYRFKDWLDSKGLSTEVIVYEPSDPSGLDFSWLISSASEMLSIELWPGFSIGGLLRIIFIVGFLFWFLKLTS